MTNHPTVQPAVVADNDRCPLALSARAIRRHGGGFWLIAAAYLVAMALNAVPTPLYPIYQARDGFSTLAVTIVFGVYAAGLGVGLVMLGHVSDSAGRKRIIVPALVLEVVCAGIFLFFPELPGLIVGRFLGGLGMGMITATATAHLHELRKANRPDAGPGLFEVVSAGANLGGLAVGTMVAGILAEYVTAPLRTPYMVFAALLILAIVAVIITPETVERLPVRPRYRPQRVTMNHGDRTGYTTAAALGFTSFAINGVYTALAAGFVSGTLHLPSHLLAGTVAFNLLASAIVAQTVTMRLSARVRQILGLVGGGAGLVLLAIGIERESLLIFVLAGIVGGAGSGMLFKSVLGSVAAMAAPIRRGEALSSLFLICYAGMSLPAVGVGIAVHFVPLSVAMYWFASILLAVIIAVAMLST